MIKLTAHEKKVELAKASAPQYGMYFDGGSTEALEAVVATAGSLIMDILTADTEEKTKRQAMALLKDAFPSTSHNTITNCNLRMGK